MPRLRCALVDRVAAEIRVARAIARADLAAADEEVRLARADLGRARAGADLVTPDLARLREQRLADVEHQFVDRRRDLTARLVAAARGLAPAAVTEWPQWTVEAARQSRGLAPDLLRIGQLPGSDGGSGVPAVVPLLDRAHLAIDGPDPAAAESVIAGVLLRAIGAVPPGAVHVSVYDPDGLGGALAGFAPLAGVGLVAFHGPGALGALLDETVATIQRVNESVLAGAYATLREFTLACGRRPEPWRIVVLLGGADPPVAGQLDRIARTGVACGVHLVTRGVPLRHGGGAAVERVTLTGPGAATSTMTGTLPIRLDPAPPATLVAGTSRLLADVVRAGPAATTLADLLPAKYWTESSAYGLSAPLGLQSDGRFLAVHLGDHPPHALIGGPTGAGKTNLIYAWLAALTSRYSPDELALYLLDFKEGVSFARFAPGRRDRSWLPHVRLAGVNINHDREFGLALLRFLADELRRRAAAARTREVTKLAELRVEDPGGHWPRIVAVIDEFQVLLTGRDAVTNEAVTLLEDLARRGRSQGIHLVLASQDVAGIEALWGRSALVAQFALRIALPKARRILADTNVAADAIPRRHAVVNADSGSDTANEVVRLADAGDRATWQELQQRMWHMRDPDGEPPRLFDGEAVPRFADLDLTTLDPPAPARSSSPAVVVVGERIDVVRRPATMTLARTPGRNLAVLGSRVDEACAVLATAARSLAATHASRVSVACFDDSAGAAADRLVGRLPRARRVDDARELLTAALDEPQIIIGYAWDAAPATLRASGLLRDVLHSGPERGVHVLGWWRSVARLRDDLGGAAARLDPIGAFVALDVHGAELAPLCPIPGGPAWYPRRHRALFFDRAVHRFPEIVIPYEVDS